MKEFERELMALRGRILQMGALAETMADCASRALIGAERGTIERVRTNGPLLDRFQLEIDGR
jgi:hypothetical protein